MFRSRRATLALALVAIVILTVTFVPGSQRAVREGFGGGAVALGPGLHLRILLYHHLHRYPLAPVVLEGPMEITTRDRASFSLPIRITARVSPGDVLTFHRGRAGRATRLYLEERAREAIRAAARTLDADILLAGDVTRRLAPAVSAELIGLGIADDGLAVGRPAPQVVFNAVADYLARKFPASARRLAERALTDAPREALHHAAMGLVHEGEGHREAAEREYLEALFLDPASPEPMSRLYLIYQGSSDPERLRKLERLLMAAIEKNTSSPMHHDWLGQVLLRMGRLDQAERAFQTAIAQAPKEPEHRISLGGLRVRQGKYAEAEAAYQEALSLRADHPLALFNLGSVAALQGQIDRALEFFHRAERAGPPSHTLYNALAQAYEQKGQIDRAVEALRRSLALRGDQPGRRAALRRLEARLKRQAA